MNPIKDTLLIEKLINSVKVRGYKKTLDLLSFEFDFLISLNSVAAPPKRPDNLLRLVLLIKY
jgi:hypothetical protein